VTSIVPTSGPTGGGTSVTITGTNFLTGATVSFGGTAATGVTVNSATSITATSTAHGAGTVDVQVTTAGGTSPTVAGDQFTYLAAPTVSAVNPSSGPSGGGTKVTITGTGFISGSTVAFGANAATSVVVVSSTTITANSPAGVVGTVDVLVTNSVGTSSATPSDQFTYSATPTVTSLNPTSGPQSGGTSVTITGTNFTGATTVMFGSNSATFTVNNATTITTTSPAS